jgi:beta-lactamase class A
MNDRTLRGFGIRDKALLINLFAFALLLIATPATPQPAGELREKFAVRLAALAAGVDGVVGYEVVDLTTNERVSHLERETFPTASAIKLAIVYELYKRVSEGRIKLDETMVLDRSKAVGGSGVLIHMGTPTLSLRDYATLMVTLSDNTATNVLIDRLGMAEITKRMQKLGLPGTQLRRHMMDGAAGRRGDENVSTPSELISLLKSLQSMPEAIALLKLPKENRLRRGLPAGVESADKSGELDGVRVDAGIVFLKNRPYAFSVMTTYLKNEEEGERAIIEMSRAAYEYFERLATSGVAGRRIGN